jgi:hypothetical protein
MLSSLATTPGSPSFASVVHGATSVGDTGAGMGAGGPGPGSRDTVSPAFQCMLDVQSWVAEFGMLAPSILRVEAGAPRRTSPSFVSGAGASSSLSQGPSASNLLSMAASMRAMVASVPCVPLTPAAKASFCPQRRMLVSCSAGGQCWDASDSRVQAPTLAAVATLVGPGAEAADDAGWSPTLHVRLQDALEVVNDTDMEVEVGVAVEASSVDVGTPEDSGGPGVWATLKIPPKTSQRSLHLVRVTGDRLRVTCSVVGAAKGRAVEVVIGGGPSTAAVPLHTPGQGGQRLRGHGPSEDASGGQGGVVDPAPPFAQPLLVACALAHGPDPLLRVTIRPLYVLHNQLVSSQAPCAASRECCIGLPKRVFLLSCEC